MKKKNSTPETGGMSRRQFLQSTALLGGTGVLAAVGGCAATEPRESGVYPLDDPENVIYSVCLQCHTSCPIKVKLDDGVISKIDGNPYSMQTLNPAVPMATAIQDGAKIDGAICPKGQAGIQTQYDPYRVVKVLKRAGKRGENKWQVVPFHQAINEIVNGGKIFSTVPGEENRDVTGLKGIRALDDPELAKAMAGDAKAVGSGKMSVADFKRKYAAHLDKLIDPDHPDLGPKNNQFVFQAGRIEHGRKEFAKRWQKGGFGSTNWFEHTSICEQSHHIAYHQVTRQIKNGAWSGGKHHMKPDLYHSRFVIFFGTGAFEANFGPPYLSNLVTNNLVTGQLKIAVVDPRLSKTAAKAWRWLPVKPGGDAALVYGMINWMLANGKFDQDYVTNSNKAAAHADNETTWTNATWLVRIEDDGPGKFLRASDIGRGGDDKFVTMVDGKPVAFDTNDTKNAVEGDLYFEGEVGGIRVKSAFSLLREYANSKTIAQWGEDCGIDEDAIIELAREFAKYGKQSVAEMYRGPVQHTSGYYNGQAVITLNMLMGNADWKGGLSVGGGHWHEDGSKKGQPFNVVKSMHPGKLKEFGVKVNREGMHYEASTLFRQDGYPAKRPWFPHTSNVYQEILPSIADGYPYPVKALMLNKGTPAFASPAADKIIETLVDLEKIPLLLACDIVVGETSMYADYIFPDSAIWERWGTPHTTPACPVAQSKVRQPTVDPLVETVTVYGREMKLCLETVMLGIAEKMDLPGYGPDGFGPGVGLTHPADFYIKMMANLAAGDKPGQALPAATEKEMQTYLQARRHLSKAVFDPEGFAKAAVDANGNNWWSRVVHLLNRGGRFEDFEKYLNSGDKVPHQFKGMFNFYCEGVAMTRHSYTGKRFSGQGLFLPVTGYDGKVVDQSKYPLKLITYKEIQGGQSRTLPNDYWLTATIQENGLVMNKTTAREMGFSHGQMARIVSDTSDGFWDLKNGERIPIEGKIVAVEGMRPGVVAVCWSFGHWAYGSQDMHIDGTLVKGDKRRRAGLCPNAAMLADPVLKNVALEDLIGGSASYFDTRVNLVAV